jgi:hypothetical protein
VVEQNKTFYFAPPRAIISDNRHQVLSEHQIHWWDFCRRHSVTTS